MNLKLPPPPATYDPLYEAQRNRLIEQAVNAKYTKNEDVLVHTPARLILVDQDGHEVEIYVTHSEQVKAQHI